MVSLLIPCVDIGLLTDLSLCPDWRIKKASSHSVSYIYIFENSVLIMFDRCAFWYDLLLIILAGLAGKLYSIKLSWSLDVRVICSTMDRWISWDLIRALRLTWKERSFKNSPNKDPEIRKTKTKGAWFGRHIFMKTICLTTLGWKEWKLRYPLERRMSAVIR